MTLQDLIIIASAISIILVTIVFIISAIIKTSNSKKSKAAANILADDMGKKENENRQKMYEIEILNKLGNRIDYSLNVENIIEVITESLSDFVDYSIVSHMLIAPEGIIFRTTVKEPVPRKFIDDVKAEMTNSISTLLNTDMNNFKVEEALFGAALSEDEDKQLGSFFNIPLVISDKIVGLLTIASSKNNFYKEEETTTLYNIAQQATQAVTRLQKLVESENSKLNAMVSSMTDGVVMIDTDNRITVVNPAARKALEFESKSDLSLTNFAEGLKQKFDLKDKIQESFRLDKIFISDEISLPTGFFKIIVSPVKDNWKTLGCAIIFRDMTKEKEVEQIKEDFTSMIVHELRSPLDSIKKMTEMMRISDVNKTKREACFQMIYSSSSDMLELINNLLDIAKIEAGKFELMKQKSDIKQVIESRVSFFDIAAKDAKIKLLSFFAKDIPDSVDFDPHTISQVLNNLLSNAIKFSKENGTVTIQTLFHKYGNNLLEEAKEAKIDWFIKKDIPNIPDSIFVAVTDNGEGIPADQIDKLFNKFTQAKRTFVSKGGTGLGLAITKSIIDSHGGVVGAESIEGQGSTFYFTLPINPINQNNIETK